MKLNAASFLIGLAAGCFGGLVGLGGGVVMIPLMVGFLKLSQHKAHGTSLVALVFTGTFTHWRLGNVTANLLAGLIPGILTGTYSGGVLAHLLPDSALRVLFAAVLIWTGFHYVKTSEIEE